MAASGNKVFVQSEVTGERRGRSLRTNSVIVFTVKGGRVRETQLFNGDQAATQAFWA